MIKPRVKARIEARIKERVAYCVGFELNDPRATFITITRVEVSDDLASARVFYSVYGSPGDKARTARMLDDASGFVRRKLGRVLRTRRIPALSWIYDDSIEYASRMNKTIRDALEKDRAINPEAHPGLPPVEAQEPDEVEREYLDFLESQEEEE